MNTSAVYNKIYNIATMSTTIPSDPEKNSMSSSYAKVLSLLSKAGKGRNSIEGITYHVHLVIMILLRAYKIRRLDNEFDFLVAIEVATAGKFDDVLYHYSSPRLGTGVLFMQAKHKHNSGSKLLQDNLFPAQEDYKSSYSIPMYFVSFLEIDQKLPPDARFVLCTNAVLDESIRSCFKTCSPQQDQSLQFCDDIGATCYQLDYGTLMPVFVDGLMDSCLTTLGKELAKNFFDKKVVTFNDSLFNTFANLIDQCIEPLAPETSDPSVSTYKLTEGFSDYLTSKLPATPIEKVQKAFTQERKLLLKKKKKRDNNKARNELTIKIDRDSFIAAKNTVDVGNFTKFHQKVREFCGKFLLVCNSLNEEKLEAQAKTLLPLWCGADQNAVIVKMKGILLEAMKSLEPVQLGREYVQDLFLKIEPTQNIRDLMRSSKDYLQSLNLKHAHVEIHPAHLKGSSLYAFLKDQSGGGVYGLKGTLDMAVTCHILGQTLSLLQYETLFVDSTKYAKHQDILVDLLSYLRDVNHPTIKVITILGKRSKNSISNIKQLSESYFQKIVVVEKMAGRSRNDETYEMVLVKHLSEKASGQLYKQAERMMFGTKTPLCSIVEETDDLSFLLEVLEACDRWKPIGGHNLNEHNYEKIRNWYVHRHLKPYESTEEGEIIHCYIDFSDTIKHFLTSTHVEPIPPCVQDGDDGKVFIFLNDAGLGITSYLTWLAWRLSNDDPSLYVIKFNTIELTAEFGLLKDSGVLNLTDTEIVRLLYRCIHLSLFVPNSKNRDNKMSDKVRSDATRCSNFLTLDNDKCKIVLEKTNKLLAKDLVELRLFQQKFNQQKLVLIVDGIDEFAPYCKDMVMNCFDRFARLDGIRSLYLSSRPYGFEQFLKNTFDRCQLYRLKPFSQKEIILSMHKFLLSKLDGYQNYQVEHQSHILDKLHTSMEKVLAHIIRIPLLLYMVQVIVLPEISKRVNGKLHTISENMLTDANFDVLHLVECIIERMIQILDSEKTGKTYLAGSTLEVVKQENTLKKDIKKQHMLLAMCVVFNREDSEKLLSKKEEKRAHELMREMNQGDGKTAIVCGIQNGVPQFLHRTFAEYFAACWLFENLHRFNSESIFHSQVIWSDSLSKTREFLDRLILRDSEGCDLHMAVVNVSYEQMREILRDNPSAVTARDKVNRLPIHLLFQLSCFVEICVDKIVEMSSELLNETDKLYGWNALDYAFAAEAWLFIKHLFKRGLQPNINNLFLQVCSNDLNVLLMQETKYTSNYLLCRKDLADELSARVANYLIEGQRLDIVSPLAELNFESVLEKVVTLDNVSLFHQLVSKLGPKALSMNDRAHLLKLALEEHVNSITVYFVEQYTSLVCMLNENRSLFVCGESAIKKNHMKLFKAIVRQFCKKQNIECIEEDNIIDELGDQSENETFDIEIPFENECCNEDSHDNEYDIEELLSVAIHFGKVHMVSYILQKTNMVVTVKLISQIIHQLRGLSYIPKNHKKCIPVFKYLFKKILDRFAVEQEELNLFFMIIKYGCVYMLPSLIAIGIDTKQINIRKHWNVFEHHLVGFNPWYSANIFVFLHQRLKLDFVDTLGPTGDSIFDLAITENRSILAQALIQAKFHKLSCFEKKMAFGDLLSQMLLKHGRENSIRVMNLFRQDSSIGGDMENEMWHSIYSFFLSKF